MGQFVEWVNLTPNGVVYFILGLGVALENIVPAIPADTFVAVGGLLSTRGDLVGLWVFGASWSFNTLSALIVYRLACILLHMQTLNSNLARATSLKRE